MKKIGPQAFRVLYRRDIPMYSVKAALCEEIIEAESLEDIVALFHRSPQSDLIEIQSLSGGSDCESMTKAGENRSQTLLQKS